MVRIEYQLTFEEFREAMLVARRQLTKQTQRSRARSPVVLTLFVLGGVLIVCGTMIVVFGASPPRPGVSLRWLNPHLVWASGIIVLLALLLLALRRQFLVQTQRMWETMSQLHQLRRGEFDDSGVHLQDALVQADMKWPLYRRLHETPRLFLLFTSDYTFEIYPKRALTDAAADELRQLVESKLAERTQRFPVLAAERI